MRTAFRSIALAGLAYVVFALTAVVMLMIPATPHGRMVRSMMVLDSFRNSPDITAGNAAFDEWLRIARQAQLVEATLLPVVAGVAVILVSRLGPILSSLEVILVVLGFAICETWRSGTIRVESLTSLGIFVFGVTVWLGRSWAGRRPVHHEPPRLEHDR